MLQYEGSAFSSDRIFIDLCGVHMHLSFFLLSTLVLDTLFVLSAQIDLVMWRYEIVSLGY